MIRTLLATALLMPALAFADEPIGDAAQHLPIFDAHIHYKEPAWGPYPPDTVIELMDRNGVAMGLVSSTPDQGTIMLWEHAPNRIVPELRPYHGNAGSSNWMAAYGMARYLQKRLDLYPHEGLGEFHVRAMSGANEDLLRKVAEMALERDIPIHIHSDDQPVRYFFEIAPELTIIWAHVGMSSPPEIIGPIMDKHDRLFADTSYRESDILDGDGLDPEWRDLLVRHADRFMIGSDTWVNGQWANYDGIIKMNREWLSYLPSEVAEKIAYRNAEKLFDRKVTKDLIGTR
ncbi:MAG: amidohydrolase family protein [Pseudomonadota bacterium]